MLAAHFIATYSTLPITTKFIISTTILTSPTLKNPVRIFQITEMDVKILYYC
jgi:hypothetical protein